MRPRAGEVIDPAECQVEPRPIEEIEQLIGTASEEADATPDAAQAGSMEGEDADEATVQAVTQTYRELVACLNAGGSCIYALYTDDYLRRTLADSGMDLQLQATPAPDRQETTALVGVSEVRQLAGGRVAVRVETTSSPEGTASAVQSVLETVEDLSDRGRDRGRCGCRHATSVRCHPAAGGGAGCWGGCGGTGDGGVV